MKIEIANAPRINPESDPNLPWNIFVDGRCTNTTATREKAEKAVQKLYRKYNVDTPEVEEPVEVVVQDHSMVMPRPRGAPQVGTRVSFDVPGGSPDGTVQLFGTVVDYLSSQFIVQEEGTDRLWILTRESEYKTCQT